MPVGELILAARLVRLASMALTLILVLSVSASSAPVVQLVHQSVPPVPGTTAYGNDISWPQCPRGRGGYGLPGPMAKASFVLMGLTDGGSFRANPCLADQVASSKIRHLWTGAYAISTYPTKSQLAHYGGTGTLSERLGRVGAAQADFNLATMARVGLRSPTIWVDVEPSKRTPWSRRGGSNNAVIDGVIARLRQRGYRAGIYSYGKAWRAITGRRVLPGVPTWVPVGRKGSAGAAAVCATASFAGSKPWLAQWTDGRRDYNRTCPGVTGRAARGAYIPPVGGFIGALFAPT